MKNKELIEARAFQIYEANPEYGRRKVAGILKTEYGQAMGNEALDRIRKQTEAYQARQSKMLDAEFAAIQVSLVNPEVSQAELRRITGASRLIAKQSIESARTTEVTIEKRRQNEPIQIPRKLYKGGYDFPIVSRLDYRQRSMALRNEGFMSWEYQYLAFHDIESPALRRMRSDRSHEYGQWVESGLSGIEIEDKLLARYKKEAWVFNDGRLNPFKMIDQYYKTDKQGQPTDKTPSDKRRGGKSNFEDALKNTVSAKQYNQRLWRYGDK